MSAYSDYKCGAMSEQEYKGHCVRANRKERDWIDEWEKLEEGENEIRDDTSTDE